jgi:hypothetical protein
MPDTTTGNPNQPNGSTSVEHNKAVSRRWIEAFNDRDDPAEADFVRLITLPILPRVWSRTARLRGVDSVPCRIRQRVPRSWPGRRARHTLLPRVLTHQLKKLDKKA